jgi:hypothetical protein
LARHELRDELRKGEDGLIAVRLEIGIVALGGGLLITMVVHLLQTRIPAVVSVRGDRRQVAPPRPSPPGSRPEANRQRQRDATANRSNAEGESRMDQEEEQLQQAIGATREAMEEKITMIEARVHEVLDRG